jgi:hypothetical protein
VFSTSSYTAQTGGQVEVVGAGGVEDILVHTTFVNTRSLVAFGFISILAVFFFGSVHYCN